MLNVDIARDLGSRKRGGNPHEISRSDGSTSTGCSRIWAYCLCYSSHCYSHPDNWAPKWRSCKWEDGGGKTVASNDKSKALTICRGELIS